MLSIRAYKKIQYATDSPVTLSIRAVESILVYCKDWSDGGLNLAQRLQSAKAGQTLCDAMIQSMNSNLPEKEQVLLLAIFTHTSNALFECTLNKSISLIENERALMKILDILKGGAMPPSSKR